MQGISLKELGLMFVPENFKNYFSGLMLFLILFGIGIVWALIRSAKDKPSRFLAVYTIFLGLTIFNPLAVKLVFSHFSFDTVYYRFIWLLPISIVPSYYAVRIISHLRSRALKTLALIVLCGAILLPGTPNLAKDRLKMPDNLYKMPDEILAVSTMIHEDAPDETVRAAMCDLLNFSMRQYDPSIELSIHRDNMLCFNGMSDFAKRADREDYQQELPLMQLLVKGEKVDETALLTAIRNTETDYLIYPEGVGLADYLRDLGFNYVGTAEGFAIFRTNI